MFGKIMKFFGLSGEKSTNNEQKQSEIEKTEEVLVKIDEKRAEEHKVSLNDTTEMREILLGDIRTSPIKRECVNETIGKYQQRKIAQRKRVQKEVKEVVNTRMTVNDMYMMERFGVKVKGYGAFRYPNFMAANFAGFIVGKCVETNKMLVFAGTTDVNSRQFVLNGRKLTYNSLNRFLSSGKITHGYKWYRVKDLGILMGMRDAGEFVDEASRIWLEDYFSYLAFVKKYREEHPDALLELDEIQVNPK